MKKPPLTLNVEDSIAHLVLNRPPGNKMDTCFFNEFTRLRKKEFSRLNVRGMLVYSSGRHFSSGADLEEMAAIYNNKGLEAPPLFLHENIETFMALESLPFPVIAVIHGCCLGAGLELALACHCRVASRHAVFALPESTYGIIPGCGGTIRLPSVVGKSRAIELILSGRTVSAQEALETGLVDSLNDKQDCIREAHRLIENKNVSDSREAE